MRLYGHIPLAVPIRTEGSPAEREASDAMSDAELRLDEAAFRKFYEEVAPRLRAYIRRVCGDSALADDLLQETFYRFLRANLPPLERWQLKAYLYRAASSLVTDHWRRTARDTRWRLTGFFGETEPSATDNTEGDVMRHFRRLKPREQTLLWLAYVEGFDHREIASALRLGERSVRVLLFRARKRFGEALRREGL